MTESTWKCACGKDNALGATVCILCKTPHAPERIEDSHLTGSVSRITGTITGLLLLAFVVWFGLLTGGGSVLAGIFVVVMIFSIGLIGIFLLRQRTVCPPRAPLVVSVPAQAREAGLVGVLGGGDG